MIYLQLQNHLYIAKGIQSVQRYVEDSHKTYVTPYRIYIRMVLVNQSDSTSLQLVFNKEEDMDIAFESICQNLHLGNNVLDLTSIDTYF